MKFNRLFLLACVLCLAITASAQKLHEKPYQKWSKDEAMKILSDSPWARTHQSESGAAMQQSAREQNDQRILGRAPTGRVERNLGVQPVVARLQSGLPIRQAFIRLQQIQLNYDKMEEAQRNKFDASAKDFLECPVCQNYYVITLTKLPKATGQGVDDGLFQTLKLEDLKGKVRLANDKGEHRELAQFVPAQRPGESAVLFFQRRDEKGASLITAESKELELVFASEFLDSNRNPYGGFLPRRFEFNISKLIINGEPAF